MISRITTAISIATGLLLGSCGAARCPERAPISEPDADIGSDIQHPDTDRRNFGGETAALAARLEKHIQAEIDASIEIEVVERKLAVVGLAGRRDARALELRCTQDGVLLATYYLVPWQHLSELKQSGPYTSLPPQMVTVTASSLVFRSQGAHPDSTRLQKLQRKIEGRVDAVVEREKNEAVVAETLETPPPEGLQVIAVDVRPFYATVLVALPGTRLPPDDVLSELAPGRMLELVLTPDIGPVTKRWIPPAR